MEGLIQGSTFFKTYVRYVLENTSILTGKKVRSLKKLYDALGHQLAISKLSYQVRLCEIRLIDTRNHTLHKYLF